LPNVAPSNVYPTSDGLVLIAANQDTVFRRLCEAMRRPELALDTRYLTHQARGARQQELDELIARWTAAQTTRQVLALMDGHGVPAGQIYRAPEMLEDPHFAAREAIVKVAHPQFGELRMQNAVPKLSATPGGIRAPSPALGEHNDAVYLGLLGLERARYDALRAARVI
ncbi:MAG TPA: CoA transferase, partial [Steroidobacteraceae bacterium]|nr:CoA transferase [Steroidobacteraceae bacterium]